MEPTARQLALPTEYGTPTKLLRWSDVRRDLETEQTYWVASTRPDGRPHVVPRDGIWLDDRWFYGGSDETVHNRNIRRNPNVAMHIGDGIKAIIVEGAVELVQLPRSTAQTLAETNNTKYSHYGLNLTADSYDKGAWALLPRRVIAWNLLFEDATRFDFE